MGKLNEKFIFPLLGLTIGIFASADLNSGIFFGVICIAISILIWCVLHFISSNPILNYKYNKFHILWVVILFTGIGAINFELWSKSYSEINLINKTFRVRGKIIDVYSLNNGDRFIIDIDSLGNDWNPSPGHNNLRLYLLTNGFSGEKNDIVRFSTQFLPIDKFAPKNPGFSKSLKRKGINYYGYARFQNIENLGHDSSFGSSLKEFKDEIMIKIEKSSLSRETGDFLISLLLGDRFLISNEIKSSLTGAGLAHILALSGMHVAILISIFMALTYPICFLGKRKLRMIIALIFLWGYVILTGFAPATVRASIMASLALWSFIIERKNSALNSLFVAAFIILLLHPSSLWDPAFQLSFICVISILIFSDKLNPIDHKDHPKTFFVINLCLISLITSIATWSLTGYYFKSIPLLFLPANIFLLPFLPLFIGAGLAYSFLLFFNYDFSLIANFLDFFYKAFIGSANLFSLNGQSLVNVEVDLTTVILSIGAILLIGYGLYSKYYKRKILILSVATCCFTASLVLIFMSTETASTSSSLRFHHSFSAFEVQFNNKGQNFSLNFPRNNIARSSQDDWQIITVDSPLKEDSIGKFTSSSLNHNFLFVGPNADMNQISALINSGIFSKIILHAGIGKKNKAFLFGLINSDLISSIHSLRDSGSLEIDL